jgi:hypothetical protein
VFFGASFGASDDRSGALSKLVDSAAAGRAAYDAFYQGRGPLDAVPSRGGDVSLRDEIVRATEENERKTTGMVVPEQAGVGPSSGQPMHPKDRWLLLMVAWGAGSVFVGAIAMIAATLHLLEKKAHAPRYPGPILIGAAVLTWLLIGWQTWLAFHQPVQGYTQAQVDAAVSTAKASVQTKLDEALADSKNAKAQLERKLAASQPASPPTPTLGRTAWSNLFNGFTRSGQLQQLSGWWVIVTAPAENSEAEKELTNLFMLASSISKTLRLAGLPDYSQDLDAPRLEGKALRGITVHGRNDAADFIAAILSSCFLVLRTAEIPSGLFDYYHRQSSTVFPEDKFVWLEIGNGSPWKGNCRE